MGKDRRTRIKPISSRYGGMILTHDEFETGELVPTWTAVDEESVTTFREAHEKMKAEGWVVDYYRTPISSDRPIEVCTCHLLGRLGVVDSPIVGQLPRRVRTGSSRGRSHHHFTRLQRWSRCCSSDVCYGSCVTRQAEKIHVTGVRRTICQCRQWNGYSCSRMAGRSILQAGGAPAGSE